MTVPVDHTTDPPTAPARSERPARLRICEGSLETISAPERAAYTLTLAVVAVVVALPLAILGVAQLAPSAEPLSSWTLPTLLVASALVAGALWWTVSASTIRLQADLESGIRVRTWRFVRTEIPWRAVESVAPGPSGGALEVGPRWYGPGRVGYTAGSTSVVIRIHPLYRKALRQGRMADAPRRRIAAEYVVSVPEPEAVASKLVALRARALEFG